MRERAVLAACLLMAGFAGAQETVFVSDALELEIREAANRTSAIVLSVAIGAELSLLQAGDEYSRVGTPSGVEGWVPSAYLLSESPPQPSYAETAGLVEYLGSIAGLHDGVSLQALTAEIERLRSESALFGTRFDESRASLPISWTIAALAFFSVVGFVAGFWCLDYLIRKRYGGFRLF